MLDATNATMVDTAALETPRLETLARDAFDTPERLAAELSRIAKAYGHAVGDSDDEVRALERTLAVALPVLILDEDRAPQRPEYGGVRPMSTVLDAMLGRCEAAHDEDRSDCEGPPDAVRIVDETQHTNYGCLLHGAVALASIQNGRVYPGSVPGGAITVYERAKLLQPFEFGHQALARGLFRPTEGGESR